MMIFLLTLQAGHMQLKTILLFLPDQKIVALNSSQSPGNVFRHRGVKSMGCINL